MSGKVPDFLLPQPKSHFPRVTTRPEVDHPNARLTCADGVWTMRDETTEATGTTEAEAMYAFNQKKRMGQ